MIAIVSLAALIIALMVVDVALAVTLLRGEVNLQSFALGVLIVVSLPIMVLLGYWLWGALRLRYTIDRNAVIIYWAGARHIIPTPRIQRVLDGGSLGPDPQVRGLHWPGYVIGQGLLPNIGRTLFFATRPLAEQVVIVTPDMAYALSPHDPDNFRHELAARLRLGPTDYLPQTVRMSAFLALPLWRDRVMYILLGLATLGCAALYAWICAIYSSLPAQLPLRGVNQPPQPQSTALLLPTIGLLGLVGNAVLAALVHGRERFAAYLLLGGVLLMQILLWIALLRGLLF